MGRPRGERTASAVFQSLWDELDRLRRERLHEDPETFAEKCGFKRAAYYEYAKHGHIPFNLLERMAGRAKAKILATVNTQRSDLLVTQRAERPGEQAMTDFLQPFLDLLERFPEERRELAAAVMFTAAQTALANLPPFAERPAGSKAHRGRKR